MPVFFLTVLAVWIFPAALFGHGVEASCVSGETPMPVETVRFMYSTGEPMMYAKIHLYSPSRHDTEILQAIADPNGYFSFVPDEEGEWRITAEDGMGHKGEIAVATGSAGVSGDVPASGGKLPLPLAAFLGVSLIFNVFLCWYCIGTKRRVSYAH
jgi:nickel transport protein